jgi:hypothetical protein
MRVLLAKYALMFAIVISTFLIVEQRVWSLESDVILRPDTNTYATVAYRFSAQHRLFDNKRPPGYPLLFVFLNGFSEPESPPAIVHRTASGTVIVQRWAQILAVLAMASLLFALSGSVFLSSLTCALMMLHHGFHLYVHTVLTEGLSNVFLLLILAALALHVRKANLVTFAPLVFLSTYWVWLRPNHWLLFLVMLPVWLFSRSVHWKKALFLLIFVSSVPVYYSFRNYSERGTLTYSVASSQTYVWHLAFHHLWYRKVQDKSPSLQQALAYIDRYGGGGIPSRTAVLYGPMKREGMPWRDVVAVYQSAVTTSAAAAIFHNFGEFAEKLYRFFAHVLRQPQGELRSRWKDRLGLLNSVTRAAAGFLSLLGLLIAYRIPRDTIHSKIRFALMSSIGWTILVFWIFHSFFTPTHANNSRFIYAVHSTMFLGLGLSFICLRDALVRPR